MDQPTTEADTAPRARLLIWNPKRWGWSDLAQLAASVAAGRPIVEDWSVANLRSVPTGGRAYLMRLGDEPRGIVGAGSIVRGSYETPHWDADRRAHGDTVQAVDVRFDQLAVPGEVLVELDVLRTLSGNVNWTPRRSGTLLPPETALALELLLSAGEPGLLEEIQAGQMLPEGAKRTLVVNGYERNPLARKRCLDHHGTRCAVCGLDLAERYGPQAKGVIHVHHLTPLTEVDTSYEVDPVNDLVPVCPNCHAVIHKRRPPYSLAEVRNMLRTWASA